MPELPSSSSSSAPLSTTFFPSSSSTTKSSISSISSTITNSNMKQKDLPRCPASFERGLYWNWTLAGEKSVQKCPVGVTGYARRLCLVTGWEGPADLSECRSQWLTTLQARANGDESVNGVAADLAKVTANKALYGGDLRTAAGLISVLATKMDKSSYSYPETKQRRSLIEEFLSYALTTGSALLSSGLSGPWGDLSPRERRNAVTQLMIGLEEAAFLLADTLPKGMHTAMFKSHVFASVRSVEADGTHVIFPSPDDEFTNWSFADHINLPPEAILENSEESITRVVFLTYRHLEDLLDPKDEHFASDVGSGGKSLFVNSRVISASLGHGRHFQLPESVVLTFSLLKQDNVSNPICAFWDYTTAAWSDEGCFVVSYNTSHVTCKCDHLTNFAVIMEESTADSKTDSQSSLRIIANAGCVICLIFIVGSVLVFTVFRGLATPRTVIHRHVCFCLMVTQLVFLIGIWRTDLPVVCGIVAGILHYAVLSAFSWMFLEG